jgi:predicted GNAT family acetyltransferase
MSKIEIVRFYPGDWEKYKEGLMELERLSFEDPELCMTEEETKECMVDDPDLYGYIALDGDKVVGETYGNILQKTDKENFFEGHWDPTTYRHYDKKTMYVTSTATHPDYRGQGIAKKLKYAMYQDLKKDSFVYCIGHSNEGIMTEIYQWFNGTIVEAFPNWYGSEETHMLTEVEISKVPFLLPVKHIAQKKDYDCSIASVAVLFADNEECPVYDESEITFGLTPEKGMSHEDMIYYALKIYGFRLSSNYDTTIEELVQQIRYGKLCIVNFQTEEGEGHYSVVFGFDNIHLYIMDVEDGKERKIRKEVFDKRWYSNLYGRKWMAWF